MIPHVCQFLLVLLNGCNNITSIFPQVTNNNNSNGTYQVQASGCNCSCTNYPNIINLCQMSNVTIPPCATTVSDVSEPTSLLPTTPGVTTLSTEEDDDVFNDQARKKKTTTKMPTTFASTTTPIPITSIVESTSILITDGQMTPNRPDSSNLEKDIPSTQITIDAREFSTTPSSSASSTRDVPLQETTSPPVAPESSTEKTIITEKSTTSLHPTTSIDSTLSTENESTPKSSDDTTTSLEEHVSLSDQSSTSPSISTTQSPTSSKTSESSVRGSTTPRYESSTMPEENTPTKDNSDHTSSIESSSTSTLYTDVTITTSQTSTMDKESTTTVHYISSTQKPDEEKVTTPLSTITETLTTLSLNDRSSPSPFDTTGLSTQSEKKEEDRSTTVKYSTTNAPTSTIQYDQTSADSTVKSSVYNDETTTPFRITLLPTMTTEEDDEIFNDKAGNKKKTTKAPTTLESTESSSTPYLISRATSELTTESPDIITTTWSTTEFVSTTQPSNDSNCDFIDQPTDKSIDPMNNAESISLRRMKRSLFSYGAELSKVLLQNNTSNVALSPINFALLLVMVRSGCRSPMKEEFDKVLNLTFDATDNRLKLFKSIVDSVNNVTNNASVEVYMANKMYLPNDVDVNPRFIKLTGIIFQSEPQTIDFRNVNSTAQQLNNWSTNRTNDKVPVFTDSNRLEPSTSLLLTSVAYFSGNWSTPFDRQFTSKNVFYADDGTEKKVCTMIQVNKFRYGQLPDVKAEFVELPFESDDNNPLSMIIMLPTNGTSLNTVAERLNKLTYSQLTDNSSIEVVELSLPKFQIESVIDLAENPEEFGLTNVTNYSDDFKCIVEAKPLQISHIIQKTVIDVHEGGCWKVPLNYICPKEERSCRNTSSIKFVVNQPFIVLVVNSEMILFSGRVNDPSMKSVNIKV